MPEYAFMRGFERFDVATDEGVAIHGVWAGKGPAVLLLHGHPQSHSTWNDVAPRLLEAGYCVVATDLRGYGDSSRIAGGENHVNYSLIQEYLRCYRLPGTLHAICEDYRAAASIDLEHDAADSDRRVEVPLLALWGARGVVGELYDVLATWREKAIDVQGRALDCGHSLQEEAPTQTAAALIDFLRAPGERTAGNE